MSQALPSKSILKTTFIETIQEKDSNETHSSSSQDRSASECSDHQALATTASSVSTLTSISDYGKNDSSDTNPTANLKFLRKVAKHSKKRHQVRKLLRAVHYFVVYGLPTICVILGVIGILVGHFFHINYCVVTGCLLLISALGLMIQSCFWGRSIPNKFKPTDVAFNMPQEDSLSEAKSNDANNSPSDSDLKDSPVVTSDSTPKPMSPRERKSTLASVSTVGMNPAQVRRLSIALNRATSELASARQLNNNGGGGMLNLARRLSMAPGFGDPYMTGRDLEAGNGWIAGRVPHGVRRGLAWNDTGASRFYASNYD